MQRWYITAGLAVLAVAGGVLAPRLTAALVGPSTPSGPEHAPTPPPEDPGLQVVRVETPVVHDPGPSEHLGHLIVDAGLDRTAVLAGAEEIRFLTIQVRAPEDLGASIRRPVDVAVVMDVSGSMKTRGKIGYARHAAKVLASNMRPGDRYSLIAFSTAARTIIPATTVHNLGPIHTAIDRIEPGGSTNLYAGLVEGGVQTRSVLEGDMVGRVIVLSDGQANVGRTDTTSLSRLVAGLAADGITVSTVGLGADFDEDRMSRLADVGGGSYDFVDDPRQLQAVFQDELERPSKVVARRARVHVELPAGVDNLEVLGWDATRTGNGFTVDLGDVHAGETRKIVARVRVAAGAPGSLDVAHAKATYLDLVDGRDAVSRALATVDVNRDAQVVAKAWDKPRASSAMEAWGNIQLERSVRAYEKGDRAEAQRLAQESVSTLRGAAYDFDDESLAEQAAGAAAFGDAFEAAEPATVEGRIATKKAKEWSLDNVR